MAARNRRTVENISDDMTDLSEQAEHNGQQMSENATERTAATAMAAFDAFNGPLAKVMDQNRMIFQKMMHAMHEESLRFVNLRWEHTGRAIESSRDCQGVMGLMAVQQEFMMELARDYADQTRRFADLMRELAEDGTHGMAEAASSATEPFRAAAKNMSAEHRSAA